MGIWTQKKGKLSTSHRSAPYRCFDQDLAEFGACWSCRTYPTTKVRIFLIIQRSGHDFFVFLPLITTKEDDNER